MDRPQVGILEGVPTRGRHLFFDVRGGASAEQGFRAAAALAGDGRFVLGAGAPLAGRLAHDVPGLRAFPPSSNPSGVVVPATQAALWVWVRATSDTDDPGVLFHEGRRVEAALGDAFTLTAALDVFRYDVGRDLSGYVDGTENPEGEEAEAAALARGADGVTAGSYAVLQRWDHDFATLAAMNEQARDRAIGRRREDNEEIADAPEAAHVKRTAQESFSPEAFLVRRSMPFLDGPRAGLAFLAFGASFAAFEAQLARMLGKDDGIVDALFTFTKPVTGSYFFCPPRGERGLDLRAFGLS